MVKEMNKAFFLDKDGVLVDNSKYPEIIPTDELLEKDILKGLKHIQEKNYKLLIISNQPWISKKEKTKEETEQVFQSILKKLAERDIKIHDYFYCPHKEEDKCDCRKPKPKMILDAAEKHNIDLKQSFVVGDREKDIEAGKRAGTKTILVLSGESKTNKGIEADFTIKNLNKINEII